MPTGEDKHFYISYDVWDECMKEMKSLKKKGYKFSQSMIPVEKVAEFLGFDIEKD